MKEIEKLLLENKKSIQRFIEIRKELRNKIQFCSKHNFEEEVRVAQLKLYHLDGVLMEYEQMIDDLEEIINTNKE